MRILVFVYANNKADQKADTGFINQLLIGWKRYPTVYTDYVREIPIGHN